MIERSQIDRAEALVVEIFKAWQPRLVAAMGDIAFTKKGDNSQVTALDVELENELKSRLSEAFPDWGFRGEETGEEGNNETYWLIDPIDGTSSFIRGLDYCTNMAALVHEGETVLGIIYDFVRDQLFTARKGEGSFCNGKRLQVTQRPVDGSILYLGSARHAALIREALGVLKLRAKLPMGASGHAYTRLALGSIDGVIAYDIANRAHDVAPGLLIVEEAGAVTLDFDDNIGVNRHKLIVATPDVAEAIHRSGLF